MTEDSKHIEFSDLTVKYLSGETSDSEVKRLEDWVLESTEHKAVFNQIKQAWILSGIDNDNHNIDVDKEWALIDEQLFSEEKVIALKPRRRMRFYLGIAAAIAVILVASIWVFVPRSGVEEFSVLDQVAVNTLPDGSNVSLNQYSSIEFESKFDKPERRIKLTGDAYFEVERNIERPFIVDADDIEVEVLGTTFYVDSREELPSIEVIVQSGTVAVSAQDQRIVLNAGESGVYEKFSRKLTKQTNEEDNYLAWKTDTLVFEEEKLDLVVRSLNRKFHAKIELDIKDTENCYLTARFADSKLEPILRIIEKSLGITTVREGEKIILTGENCL
jgi:ferric-dicitrate binding protein FerR (iron transport regulator)